ncbi:MAG: DUF4013 domain-containing protein, partial [Myxococcales bacterium]|nr:DUF4013 domain-containing protein [Myxococcales bacterium]
MSVETPASVSIGDAFAVFSEDPDWMKKVAIVGACRLIPVVGSFQALGYFHRVFEHARQGNKGLPDPALGDNIGVGFFDWLKDIGNLFPVVLLNLAIGVGCILGSFMLGAAAGGAGSDDPGAAGGMGVLFGMVGALFGYGWILLSSLLVGVLAIDLTRRIFCGENFPLLSPGATLGAIKRSPGAFFMTWLGLWICGIIGGIGFALCFVGVLFTMPLSFVLRAR